MADEYAYGLLRAAFVRENDIVALGRVVGKLSFPPDPQFSLMERGKDDPLFNEMPEQFTGVHSDKEYDWVSLQLNKSRAASDALHKGGLTGFGAAAIAGITSPTIFLPGGAVYKSYKSGNAALQSALSIGAASGVAVAAQEAVLQTSVNDRQLLESAMNVGVGSLIGSGLGAGVSFYLSKGSSFINRPRPSDAIPEKIEGTDQELSYVNVDGEIRLAPSFKIAEATSFLSPLLRNFVNKYSPEARRFARDLDSNGLLFLDKEGNPISGPTVADQANMMERSTADNFVLLSSRAIQKYQKETTNPLSRDEVYEQVFDSIHNPEGEYSDIVLEVKRLFQEKIVYPYYNEANRIGFAEDWMDPEVYFPYILKHDFALKHPDELEEILTEHYEEVLIGHVEKAQETKQKLQESQERLEEVIKATPEEVEEMKKNIRDMIRKVLKESKDAQDYITTKDSDLKKQLAKTTGGATIKKLLGEERKLTRLLKFRKDFIEGQQKKKLDQIAEQERLSFKNMEKAIVMGKRLLKDIKVKIGDFEEWKKLLKETEEDSVSWTAHQKEVIARWKKELKEKGEVSGELWRELYSVRAKRNSDTLPEEYLEWLFKNRLVGELEMHKVIEAIEEYPGMVVTAEDIRTIANMGHDLTEVNKAYIARRAYYEKKWWNNWESYHKEVTIDEIPVKVLELEQKQRKLIERRGAKIQTLTRQVEDLDVDAGEKFLHEQKLRRAERIARINTKLAALGIEGDDIHTPASKLAKNTINSMLFSHHRVADVGNVKLRGPELERKLNIDPLRVWSNGRTYSEFLEKDVEVVARIYAKTLSGDLEIYRKFGTLNPFRPGQEAYEKVKADFDRAREEAKKITNEKKREKALADIGNKEKNTYKDLEALVARIRHIWGVPKDMGSIINRAGNLVLQLNLLRLMGSVVPSSIPDLARPLMRQGFQSAYGPEFVKLMQIKDFRAGAKEELRAMGVGLDFVSHTRILAMADLLDGYFRGSKAERVMQYAANNFGKINLADYYNSFVSEWAGVSAMIRTVQEAGVLATGKGDMDKAIRFLAQANISPELAKTIWEETTKTGELYNGVWLPNTEQWTNQEAARQFKASIYGQVTNTILRPGLERPLVADHTMTGRLIFQFRSFALATHTKTLVHAAQELKYGNKNIPFGVALSMGLGALSYYINAHMTNRVDAMQNASVGKWIDESMVRSGLLGIVTEVITTAQKIPGISQYASFSGEGTIRAHNPYRQPLIDAFGPSVGLLKDVTTLMATVFNDPSEATVNAAVRLIPYQNLFYLRNLIGSVKQDAYGLVQ